MKKILALFLLLALLALPACGGSKQDPIPVKVDELIAAYKENEARANEMYRGKTLFILGTVTEIKSSYVNMRDVGGVPNQHLEVNFDKKSKDMKKLSELNVGDMIAVTGQIQHDYDIRLGYSSQIRIWDCALVPLPD